MDRYKGKRLKQQTHSAVLPHEEEPDAAQAAADAAAPPPAAVLPHEEEANAAQAAADNAAPRTKKSRWFWIALAIYAAILLAVSGYLQSSLWRFLENSQAEMDRQAAERDAQLAYEKALYQAPQLAFEAWRSGLTADYWTDLWYAKASSDLDARVRVQEFMAERFAPGAIEAYKAAGYTDEAPVYVLKNGEDSLARVTLAGSELNWSVSEVELLLEGACSASVTVADRCQVYCNGKELGGEYGEAAGSHFHYEPLEDQLEGAVTWVSYSVEGLLLEPELTVEPPEGCCLIRTEEGDYLLGLADGADVYTDTAVEFVRDYLYYFMSGRRNTWSNMSRILSYLTPGTQAYQDISDTYRGVIFNNAYSNIDTSKTAAGDVFVWADNCFSVDVAYNANCTWAGSPMNYADGTMRIYFLQTTEGYTIRSFELL